VGSVAVWGYSVGAFGHVGYVEAVNADGSILISQYNWDLRGEYSTMTVAPGSAYWPSKGFLN
jgi:surface antigen